MIDFHTHILPSIDDGAKDVATSLKLIEMERSQGVDVICLTPHFYAKNTSFSEFLERREISFEILMKNMEKNDIRFVPGAETYYYRGISENSELEKLKLKGTDILLMEMPFRKWTNYEIRELRDIAERPDTRLLMAHFERYLNFNGLEVFEDLLNDGALIQTNATFFEGFWNKRNALKLLKKGYIDVMGSDAHSLERRPPKLNIACDAIEKSFGREFLDAFLKNEQQILGI